MTYPKLEASSSKRRGPVGGLTTTATTQLPCDEARMRDEFAVAWNGLDRDPT